MLQFTTIKKYYLCRMNLLVKFLRLRCPRCGDAPIFSDTNPYHLKNLTKMPDKCPKCQLSYKVEMGFYWGAMYVSYMLNALFFLMMAAVYVVTCWGHLIDWAHYFIMIASPIFIIISPYTLRLSRWLWLWFDYEFFIKRKKGL